jgi:DUF3047 family protein
MRILLYSVMIFWPFLTCVADEQINVARFSQGDLSGWQTKTFAGETDYALEKSNGAFALRADSDAAASGRYREINIDLNKTPILNWTWKVNNILPNIDERTRGGDDYAARVYVVFSSGMAFWRTRAINYVWSSNQPTETNWPNAFTSNVQMIAVKSGTEHLEQWLSEKRNVASDYRHLFGEEPRNINAVAIMTDTDNTSGQATAWYGDIWFTSK